MAIAQQLFFLIIFSFQFEQRLYFLFISMVPVLGHYRTFEPMAVFGYASPILSFALTSSWHSIQPCLLIRFYFLAFVHFSPIPIVHSPAHALRRALHAARIHNRSLFLFHISVISISRCESNGFFFLLFRSVFLFSVRFAFFPIPYRYTNMFCCIVHTSFPWAYQFSFDVPQLLLSLSLVK